MAYSRWSNSIWYTFWSTSYAHTGCTREEQVLVVHRLGEEREHRFTYAQIKKNPWHLIAQVCEGGDITESEKHALLSDMNDFMRDVEADNMFIPAPAVVEPVDAYQVPYGKMVMTARGVEKALEVDDLKRDLAKALESIQILTEGGQARWAKAIQKKWGLA